MNQDPISEAYACRRDEDLRKTRGLFALAGAIVFALFAVIAGLNVRVDFDFYHVLVGVFAGSALVCFIVAVTQLAERSVRSREFDSFLDGFGDNLKLLTMLLKLPLNELKNVNVLERATIALDELALAFVTVEHSLKIGLGRRLKRQDWKFDPAWNEARATFSKAYDVCERFDLVEPVEKKGDEWKPYIARAEAKLTAAEDTLGL